MLKIIKITATMVKARTTIVIIATEIGSNKSNSNIAIAK
jgi:hypothetical protein